MKVSVGNRFKWSKGSTLEVTKVTDTKVGFEVTGKVHITGCMALTEFYQQFIAQEKRAA